MKSTNYLAVFSLLLCSACSESGVNPGDESNLELAQEFGIYLVQNDSLIYKENEELDIDKIMIVEQPLIVLGDIDHYDSSSQTLHLNKAVGWQDIPVYSAPFIVAEDGEILHYGYFYNWPNCCWPRGPVSLTVYNHPILEYTLQVHGFEKEKIINALPGTLRQSDIITKITEVELIEEDGKVTGVEITLQITNNLNHPVYLIDVDKIPGYALKSWIYFGEETGFWGYDYNLEYTLPANPGGPSEWSLDWYSLVAPDETLIRTLQVESWGNAVVNEGTETGIIFTLDNMAGTIPPESFENLDHPVWIGKIIHKQALTF